jgi:hypothetical protein
MPWIAEHPDQHEGSRVGSGHFARLAGLSTRTLYAKLPPRTLAQEEAANGKRHA